MLCFDGGLISVYYELTPAHPAYQGARRKGSEEEPTAYSANKGAEENACSPNLPRAHSRYKWGEEEPLLTLLVLIKG